ncbi:LysR family transcriptional regulator, partial [Nocardia sp. NPDC052278]
MDTRVLATFVALARTGSFTATAVELHLAQSTVTAHIKALEAELGLRLLDRLPVGATLTDAGRRTLEKASLVLDAEAALRADPDVRGPIEGTVGIVAPESLCGHLLPAVIAALQRRHPGVEVTLSPAG